MHKLGSLKISMNMLIIIIFVILFLVLFGIRFASTITKILG